MNSRNPRPISLRQRLLAWLLPGVVFLLVASGGSAYFFAWRNATLAYDRSLLNLAIALANQVHSVKGHVRLDLTPQGQQILLTDKYDKIHFAVFGPHGELLGGEAALFPTQSPTVDAFNDNHLFFDGSLQGSEIRGVILLARQEGQELTILVGETLVKRQAQVSEILLSIIVPEFFLAVATIAVIMFGVGSGLRPLDVLRQQLARRSPQDLSPIDRTQMPAELQPLAAEIDQLLQRLHIALDAQRHFVSDASHQLRTPMAALQAQLESVIREHNDLRLAPILAALQRLSHLVHQLLVLARAEPGSQPVRAPVELKQVIHDMADRWMPLAISREIDLGFELESAPLRGSPLLLEELVSNLVDNAIRYTPVGGQVTVRCGEAETGGALLAIEDSGPGIPADMRQKVFERFFRLGEGAADGCGLGLAVVRQIAGQHDARVEIDEAPGGGAVIKVYFPAVAAG